MKQPIMSPLTLAITEFNYFKLRLDAELEPKPDILYQRLGEAAYRLGLAHFEATCSDDVQLNNGRTERQGE